MGLWERMVVLLFTVLGGLGGAVVVLDYLERKGVTAAWMNPIIDKLRSIALYPIALATRIFAKAPVEEDLVPVTLDRTNTLLTGPWELNFQPSTPGRRKLITFLPNGQIGEGKNKNEHTWALQGTELAIMREDGSLQNKFAFEQDSEILVCTNDPTAKGIQNQTIYRP